MKKSCVVGLVLLTSFVASGCWDANQRELARAKAEVDETRAELARTRDELARSRADADALRADVAGLRADLDRLRGGAPARPAEPAGAENFDQKISALRTHYNNSAISLDEYTRMKAKTIEQIPAVLPADERRTLGRRLIDLSKLYDASALSLDEWTKAKGRVIAQTPSPRAATPSLDRELAELKQAYDASAASLDEWTRAKGEVAKWAK